MARYAKQEKYRKPRDRREMLLLAIEREEASISLYEDMTIRRFPPEVKQLISRLRDEELLHKKKLKEMLLELYNEHVS